MFGWFTITIVNYVTVSFQLEIKKLADNLQLKDSHLRIMQVSFIVNKHCVNLNYILYITLPQWSALKS